MHGAASDQSAASSTGVTVGQGGPTIELFVDFSCPACKNFEQQYGSEIARRVDSGDLTVSIRPLTFLDDRAANGKYSARAAGALQLVGQHDADLVLDFVTKLFQVQPTEGLGLTNAQIARAAEDVGVSTKTAAAIGDGPPDVSQLARLNLEYLQSLGGASTPTVVVNGTKVDLTNRAWLEGITS